MGRLDNAIKALRGARIITNKDFVQPLSSMTLGGSESPLNHYNTKTSQLSANVGAVYSANDIIVKACSSVEIKLRKKTAKGYEPVLTHKLLDLLDEPNAFLTGEQLKQLHFTYMNLVGEAYLLKMDVGRDKVPAAMHVLPAHNVEFTLGDNWDNSKVRYNNTTYTLFDVVRDINPDPINPYRGRSVISAAAASIDMDEQAKAYNRRFFANSARPSVVVETQGELSDEAYERFKQSFNEAHQGVDNAHKPIILEGATIKPYMLSQKEMDFLATRQFTRKEILAFFLVSDSMLGNVENANRSNMDASEYNLAKYAIAPRVNQYVKLLTLRLARQVDPNLEFYTDPIVPEDLEGKLKEASEGTNNWQTIDETRAKYGLDPLPNGQGAIMYIPANLVPIDKAGTVQLATPSAEGDKAADGQKKKPLTYPTVNG